MKNNHNYINLNKKIEELNIGPKTIIAIIIILALLLIGLLATVKLVPIKELSKKIKINYSLSGETD